MKTILIVCDMFTTPSFLPRVRFFCKYLTTIGYKVEILSEKPRTEISLDYPCYFIEYQTDNNKTQWYWHTVLNTIANHKCDYFYHKACNLLKGKHYDAIICSTFYTFPLPAAAKLAKQWNIPLLADVRDMPEQAPMGTYLEHHLPHIFGLGKWLTYCYRNNNIQLRNKALTQAQAVLTVSEWHKEQLAIINPHTFIIYNGYDSDLFKPQRQKTNKFTINYLGRVYDQRMQQPELLMQSLSNLLKQNVISDKIIEVNWYSPLESIEKIRGVANKYQVNHLMQYNTTVVPENIPHILNESSISLVLSNKNTISGTHGIMTTKVFEAMGSECPVLCVRSDEDCLERIIKQTNIGVAARTQQECTDFIVSKLNEWKEKGYTTADVCKEQINKYSRQNQTTILMQLLDSIC